MVKSFYAVKYVRVGAAELSGEPLLLRHIIIIIIRSTVAARASGVRVCAFILIVIPREEDAYFRGSDVTLFPRSENDLHHSRRAQNKNAPSESVRWFSRRGRKKPEILFYPNRITVA